MRIHRILVATFLAAVAIPASATSTMCMFEGSSDSSSYSIEFIGHGEIGGILMSLRGGPRSLPAGSYQVLEFDERRSEINLAYRNPGDSILPPSFTLEGVSKNVRMTIGKAQIVGELHCDF